MDQSEASKALMWRITEEIWNQNHPELIDELIVEDLIDHLELPGVEATGRARYRASVELMRAAFPDFQNPLDFVLGDGAVRGLVRSQHRDAHRRAHGHPTDGALLRCPRPSASFDSRTGAPSNGGASPTTWR